ncbi:MAG: Crp/Fnr family transcriptional regulator [Prolixibacteraceae bacterium]
MISILKEHLIQHTKLNQEDIITICTAFTPATFKVDEAIIPANSKVTFIGFIVEGICRAVEYQASGERTIHYFINAHHFFSEANGLFKNKPAKLAIEAATPCKIVYASIEELYALTERIIGLERELYENKEKELVAIIEAQEILHKGKSLERYLAFIEQNPDMSKQIKDKDIAAYLGISKFTLSHLKKSL